MSETFQRRVEDFTCTHCGVEVQGDGYTNHCPTCLWSMHIDIFPGDRGATCRALMKPIGIEQRRGGHRLVHECIKCGYRSRNRFHPDDNQRLIIEISTWPVSE